LFRANPKQRPFLLQLQRAVITAWTQERWFSPFAPDYDGLFDVVVGHNGSASDVGLTFAGLYQTHFGNV
jgi:hypothetical protein